MVGTLSTQIPTEWLGDGKKMAEVKAKMLGKVGGEIDRVIGGAVEKWMELTR